MATVRRHPAEGDRLDSLASYLILQTLAADPDLHVVADGVPTEPVRRHLADAGCRWAQGWAVEPRRPGSLLPGLLPQPDAAAESQLCLTG